MNFQVLFLKKIPLSLKEKPLNQTMLLLWVEEELDGIDIDGIGNLLDLLIG